MDKKELLNLKPGDVIQNIKSGMTYKFISYKHKYIKYQNPNNNKYYEKEVTFPENYYYNPSSCFRLENWKVVTDTHKETQMEKLYQTVAEPTVYCTKLAVARDGSWVMQPVEKGAPFNVSDPNKELIEVIPYTVRLVALANANDCHVTCKEGALKLGDILLSAAGSIYKVSELDTKMSNCKEFKGRRILTEEI